MRSTSNQTWRAAPLGARPVGPETTSRPSRRVELVNGAPDLSQDPINLSRLSVLLFDDDFQSRGSLRNALRATGIMRIGEASCDNASLASGFGLPSKIDVIFSEVRLRNGNGLALLKAIRMGRIQPLKSDVCFVLFTNHVDDVLVKAAAALNANGYVLKPAAPETVRAAIIRGRNRSFTPDPARYRLVDTSVAGTGFGTSPSY